MSAAIKAKSAKARATIARNLRVKIRRGHLGRSFDDCFEIGDGDNVLQLLIERVQSDEEFCAAVLNHSDNAPQRRLAAANALGRPNEDKIWKQRVEHAQAQWIRKKHHAARRMHGARSSLSRTYAK